MTPTEAAQAVTDWLASGDLPSTAEVSVSLNTWQTRNASLNCRVYPRGFGYEKALDVEADDFATLINTAKERWAEISSVIRAQRIRKLAMAIIDVCDGASSAVLDRDLRLQGFSDREIDDLGTEACEEALRLGRDRFSIVRTEKANAA